MEAQTQNGARIVDADAHVNPPHTFWAEYLPAHLREHSPRIEHGEDADYVVFEGQRKKLHLMSDQAGRKGQDFKVTGRVADMRAGGFMASERLRDMDTDGIDAAILYGGGPLPTQNVELYIESYRAYNRWLADFCSHDRKRLHGVAYIPLRDVDESIAMLREARALGFAAANMPAFPQGTQAMKTSGSTGASPAMAAQSAALTGDPYGERRLDQPERDLPDAVAVVGPGELVPDAEFLLAHRDLAGPVLGVVQQQLRKGVVTLDVAVLRLHQAGSSSTPT